jgi:glycine cleavage system H protein
MVPQDLRYTETHEWARLEGEMCTVGITQFAVEQLTDVVHVELPAVGQTVEAGKPFGEVESVKAVSDLYSPVSGEVIAVNEQVRADPALIARDPYGQGWLIRLRLAPGASLAGLLTPERYARQIASATS